MTNMVWIFHVALNHILVQARLPALMQNLNQVTEK